MLSLIPRAPTIRPVNNPPQRDPAKTAILTRKSFGEDQIVGTRPVNRTERLAEIEQMLFRSVDGLRAVEIAEACGVDRRTIYRDLSLLTDIGVPIAQTNGRFFIKYEHYLAKCNLAQTQGGSPADQLVVAGPIGLHLVGI